jgi:hypothetical protein
MMVWLEQDPQSGEWFSPVDTEMLGRGENFRDAGTGQLVSWAMGRAPVGARCARLRVGDATSCREVIDGWYVVAIWHEAPSTSSVEFQPS